MSCNPKSGTELKKEEFASTMMVKTSIDSGAAPVSYLNEEYLVARDRSDGMSSIVYRKVTELSRLERQLTDER